MSSSLFIADEEFRQFPDFPDYWSNQDLTKLWNSKRQKWMKIGFNTKSGRPNMSLKHRSGEWHHVFLYRPHCHAWVGDPPFQEAFVLHKDDNFLNNHPSNLYYGDRFDNARDLKANRKKIGKDYPSQGRISEHVLEIRKRFHAGETIPELMKAFNETYSTIRCIVINKTWKDPKYVLVLEE